MALHGATHPGADPTCPTCHGLGVCLAADGPAAVALRCDCVGPCPLCEDGGWLAEGPNVHRCQCHVQAERQRLYDEVRLPSALLGPPLERWEPSPAVEAALRWLSTWRPEPGARGLILQAPDGDRIVAALVAEVVLGLGAPARFLDLREPGATFPEATACRVLALAGLGDEASPAALERCLMELEGDATLVASTRHHPAWDRREPGGPAALGERMEPLSAALALESCEVEATA